MKKYMICLFLFLGVSMVCGTIGFVMTRNAKQETVEETAVTQEETETVQEGKIVSNQEQISHEPVTEPEEFYLVSEDGYLLVFCKDKKTINLYTHIPVMDFPEEERIRLMDGIWFETMMDVFNYLESYTS